MPLSNKDALLHNASIVKGLRSAVDFCNINHVPKTVREVLRTGAWAQRYELMHVFQFEHFIDFITADRDHGGCGWTPDTVRLLLLKAGDPEALEMWDRAVRAKEAAIADAKAPDLQEAHRPKKPDTKTDDIRVSQYGTSNEYAIAKLRKDAPAIHARVLAGEISANAGMIEAGFRKKRQLTKLSRVERECRRIDKMTKVERRAVWSHLDKEFGS